MLSWFFIIGGILIGGGGGGAGPLAPPDYAYDCETFKGGPEANIYNAFLLNTTVLGSSSYFLKLNTLC